MKLLRNHSKIH